LQHFIAFRYKPQALIHISKNLFIDNVGWRRWKCRTRKCLRLIARVKTSLRHLNATTNS